MNRNLAEELRRFEAEIAVAPKCVPAFIPSQVAKNVPRQLSFNQNGTAVKNVGQQQPKVSTNTKSELQEPTIQLEKNVPNNEGNNNLNISAIQAAVEKKLKKLKKARQDKLKKQESIKYKLATSSSTSGRHKHDDNKKKVVKNRKLLRTAGGTVWEDITLAEWPEDDYRIFCGDLGNDVTDELLVRTFSKFPSFLRARVIRDRRTNKSKGYGFVSFKDPNDFTKAMKEMNGRYVGSRPIKLKRSCWKNRAIDVVRKREKEKSALVSLLQSGLNKPIA